MFTKEEDIDFEEIESLDNETADDDEDVEEPKTTSATNKETSTKSQSSEEDKTTEDSKDTSNKDTDEVEAKKEKDFKNAENAKQAQLRREREAKEEAKREGYKKGVVEALGKINPFTNEKMEDDTDFEVYEKMKKCQEAGFDPLTEMYKYDKKLILDRHQEEKQIIETKERARQDIKEMAEQYPDINLSELLKNQEFQDLFGDVLDSIGIKKAYEKYVKISNKAKTVAKDIATKEKAKEMSSAGSAKNTNGGEESDYYTKEQLQKLTPKDLKDKRVLVKAMKSYERL